jgi:c-di-GMP-binding flagellar brake protein YcgR
MHYGKYFGRNQKVFLINISDERDESVYNSFTGKVLVCDEDKIILKTAYRLYSGEVLNLKTGMMFKLTTEAMGMGVQIKAELSELISPEELKLRPIGELSVYQRRQTPRVDTILPLLYVPQKSSLAAFQREWKRVISDLYRPNPPRPKLSSVDLNLSAGGTRLGLPNEPSHLSLLVIDLQDEKPPVCAVAELVWQQQDEEHSIIRCGHRFVEILKDDQERIAAVVGKSLGERATGIKQRELLDRMVP